MAINSPLGIGAGQSWQYVVRTPGVTYYNLTGRPITLLAYCVASSAPASQLAIAINGAGAFTFAYEYSSVGGNDSVGLMIIPPGASYVISGGNIGSVTVYELR